MNLQSIFSLNHGNIDGVQVRKKKYNFITV